MTDDPRDPLSRSEQTLVVLALPLLLVSMMFATSSTRGWLPPRRRPRLRLLASLIVVEAIAVIGIVAALR